MPTERRSHVSPKSSGTTLSELAVHVLVDEFFDALGHFPGEQPALAELARLLAPDAEIFDDEEQTAVGAGRYARDAWLRKLARSSGTHGRERFGQFFEEVERSVSQYPRAATVGCLVEESLTEGGAVAQVETLRCELTVEEVDEKPSIVQVRVVRSSRPPAK
jgi:hypothetical protein